MGQRIQKMHVKSVVEMDCGSKEECGRKHSYYQWVAIVILFQVKIGLTIFIE